MKLGRIAVDGSNEIGIFENGSVTVVEEIDSFQTALEQVMTDHELPTAEETYDTSEIEYRPPTTERNQVFAVALNYRSHVDEQDTAIPGNPLIFLKMYRSLTGHEDPIAYHTSVTNELDYEGELAAVIGESAKNINTEEALDAVAGYTILNDTSARDVQYMTIGNSENLDWFSGKAMQDTTPIGPYFVTTDELNDPQSLHIESRLNGEVMQDEDTNLMIRSVAELISFISTRVRLEPGDVIATGTPEGVGAFQDIRLEHGDTVEITIDGIGTLANEVVQD